ncbi:Trk system potassium transporter TrkA [Candidatus Sumerlaeota bacterium]|nr:Trk system potassium transporter TrkA [Candidatus Sumerlaeota bacterium]
MNILIIGAGTVGTFLAKALVQAGHSIVIMDSDRAKVTNVQERLDVSAVHGQGTDHAMLRRADVAKMDLALAMTNIDEVNLICALTCKRMGAKRTIARVRNPDYLDSPEINYREITEVDLLISPERQTSVEIAKFLENPDAVELESYAHGAVQMRQVALEKPCAVLGVPLAEAKFPEGVLVAAIRRGAKIVIPTGKDRLHLDDLITLVGLPRALEKSDPLLGQTTPEAKHIAILGGGHVGRNLARLLEGRPCEVRLFEKDAERAKTLGETLGRTTVICGDASNIDVLREERVGSADVFVATTGEDEDNIMATQLARELGVKQSIVLVHRPDYASVIQRMGFDHVLSPREVTAKHVLQHMMDQTVRSTSILGGGAELIEIIAGEGAVATRHPLREVRLPAGTLICCIVHGDEVRVAHGDDIIAPGDTVIAIALTKAVRGLRAKLA